jgi:hypothetical protein
MMYELCNWNFGRTFGDCSACEGLTEFIDDSEATAGDLVYGFETMARSIEDAIPKLVSEISSVTFTAGSYENTFNAEVTLTGGVVSTDLAYNKMVYQISRILDVFPGTISWTTVSTKRQANSIVIELMDEVTAASSGLLVVPFGLLVVLMQVFFY